MTLRAWTPEQLDEALAHIKNVADTDFRLAVALTVESVAKSVTEGQNTPYHIDLAGIFNQACDAVSEFSDIPEDER